jgi:hypothetical protein
VKTAEKKAEADGLNLQITSTKLEESEQKTLIGDMTSILYNG